MVEAPGFKPGANLLNFFFPLPSYYIRKDKYLVFSCSIHDISSRTLSGEEKGPIRMKLTHACTYIAANLE